MGVDIIGRSLTNRQISYKILLASREKSQDWNCMELLHPSTYVTSFVVYIGIKKNTHIKMQRSFKTVSCAISQTVLSPCRQPVCQVLLQDDDSESMGLEGSLRKSFFGTFRGVILGPRFHGKQFHKTFSQIDATVYLYCIIWIYYIGCSI